jgi:RimJ/RimL family protein N-acetyltransferase
MNSIVIETERLFLREWIREDFHRFKPIATNPKVMKYIGTGELWSDERIDRFIDNNIDLYKKYGFCLWALIQHLAAWQRILSVSEIGEDEQQLSETT